MDVSPSFMNTVMKSLIPVVGFVWDTFFIHFGVSLTLACPSFKGNLDEFRLETTGIVVTSRVHWPTKDPTSPLLLK